MNKFFERLVLIFVVPFLAFGAYVEFEAWRWRNPEWEHIKVPLMTTGKRLLTIDDRALFSDTTRLEAPPFDSAEVGSEGSRLARQFIAQRFTQIGLTPFGDSFERPFAFTLTEGAGWYTPGKAFRTHFPAAVNIVGYIPGTLQPERYIVVAARYDTHVDKGIFKDTKWRGNASGVATMLSIAAYLKQHPPKNGVIFAAFDAGLLHQSGSHAFVAEPPVPLENIAVILNLDMVNSQTRHLLFVAGVYHTRQLNDILQQASYWSEIPVHAGHDKPKRLAGWVADWTYMSDHAAFHAAGIPFLFAGADLIVAPWYEEQLAPDPNWTAARAANFLTTLAVKLDTNLDSLPKRAPRPERPMSTFLGKLMSSLH